MVGEAGDFPEPTSPGNREITNLTVEEARGIVPIVPKRFPFLSDPLRGRSGDLPSVCHSDLSTGIWLHGL